MAGAITRTRWLGVLLCLILAGGYIAIPAPAYGDVGPSPLDQYVFDSTIAEGRGGYPQAVARDDAMNLYITETDYAYAETSSFDQIAKFGPADPDTPLAVWGSAGSGEDPPQFLWPAGVAVDSTGRVIVADSDNYRIMVLDSAGDFVASFGAYGSANSEFDYPMGVTVDGFDNIYVADTYNGRVQKFASSGTYLTSWTLPDPVPADGMPPAPDGIACDAFGNVWVVDAMYSRLYKYTSAGVPLLTISSWTDGGTDTFQNPQGVALDALGTVYISDTMNARIVRFKANGDFVQSFGEYGNSYGDIGWVEDLVVDDDGNLYLADSENDWIAKFDYVPDVDDLVPPVTTSNIPSGWTPGPWNVTLTAVDASSTVAATYYSTDGTTPTVEYTAPVPVSHEGTTTVTYYSVDAAGNEETPTAELLRIDDTKPVTTSDAQATYISSATIHLTASDELSGVHTVWWRLNDGPLQTGTTITTVNVRDGHKLQFWAEDHAGNLEDVNTVFFDVEPFDDQPPVTTSDISPNWYRTPATVSLTATDSITGVAATYYKVDDSATTTYSVPFSVATEGIHTVSFWSVDTRGNVETTKTATVRLDMTRPVTTSDAQGSYVESGTVTLEATDNLSGIARTEYRLNGGSWVQGTSIYIGVEGHHTLEYKSADNAGNEEQIRFEEIDILPVDIDPPTTDSNIPSGWTPGSSGEETFTVELIAFDAVSGVRETVYEVDGVTQTVEFSVEETTTTYFITFPVVGEGVHSVSYYSVDARGNVETMTTVPLRIDNTPPSSTSDAIATYIDEATIHFFATDELSGVSAYWYQVDSASPKIGSQVTIFQDGWHTVKFWAVDGAGNIEDYHTAVIEILPPDTDPPVTTSNIPEGWQTSPVTVTLEASESVSPPAVTYYSTNGGTSYNIYTAPFTISNAGITNVAYYSKDQRDNYEDPIYEQVKIDYDAPTTTSDNVGLYYDSAYITLTPLDAHSGVAQTYWRLNGGAWQTGTMVEAQWWGYYTLEYYSVDNAGHAEELHSESFSIRYRTLNYEESHERVVLKNSWTIESDGGSSNGHYAWSDADGAQIHVYFTGVEIEYYAEKGPDYGEIRLTLDNGTPQTFDLFNTSSQDNKKVFDSGTIANGYHYLLIERTGQKNPSSSGTKMSLDRFLVEGSLQIVPDTEAPVTTSDVPDGWVNSNVLVTLSSTDATTGVAATYYSTNASYPSVLYAGPFAVVNEGQTPVKYYSVDVRGNAEAVKTEYVMLDKTAPSTTSNAAASYTGTATVTLSASDALSGVASTEWRVDGGEWQQGTIATVPGAVGTHALEFRSTDVAGNVEEPEPVSIDIMARYDDTDSHVRYTGTWGVSTGSWYHDGSYSRTSTPGSFADIAFVGTRIHWITTKGPSFGIAKVTLDDGDPVFVDLYAGSWQHKSVVWTASGLADALHTVRIEYTGTKNPSATNTIVGVDALDLTHDIEPVDFEEPVTADDAPQSWARGPVDVSLTATDAATAIDTTYYWLDDGEQQIYSSPIRISEEGTHTLAYRSVDVRGNTETTRSATVRIDDTAPVTTHDTDEAWQNGPVSVTLTADDGVLSGVDATYYRVDGGQLTTYTAPFEIAEEGEHTVQVYSVDVLGNMEYPWDAKVRVDDTPPSTTDDALTSYASTATASLSASDALSGVETTEWRLNSGTWSEGTTLTIPNQPDTHILEYRSTDVAGNVEPTKTKAVAVLKRFEQADPLLNYTGTWKTGTAAWYSGGSYTYATAPGSYADIVFEGTEFGWYTSRGPCFGIARVSVDGGTPVDVDLYSPSYNHKALVWSIAGLTDSKHRIRIEYTGTKDPAATSAFVGIDAIDVPAHTLLKRSQESNADLYFVGNWNTGTATWYSNGAYKYAMSEGAYVDVKFTGTRLDWITSKGPSFGIARLILDGGSPVLVDLYSSTWKHQSVAWHVDGLTPREHTLRIEYTGTKNPAATSPYVGLDALDTDGVLSQAAPQIDFVRYQQTNSNVFSLGTWKTNTGTWYSGGSYMYATEEGTYADLAFTGTHVQWITSTGPCFGIAEVILDGSEPITVDLYSSSYRHQRVAWKAWDLADGPHTVRIRYTGTKNPAASSAFVGVDAFDVCGTLTNATPDIDWTLYEENDPSLSYESVWETRTATWLSGGAYTYATDTTSAVEFTFEGTHVEWITSKGACFGIARVTLDGQAPTTVDLYASAWEHQKTVWRKWDLEPGVHTVRIEYTGTKNASASSAFVGVDAIRISGLLLDP